MNDLASKPAVAAGRRVPSRLIFFFGALAALGPLSVDAYLPAMPSIARDLGVGIVQMNHTLSVFLFGYAIGQFFGGAFSDQIGRKRVGYAGLGLYIVTSFAIPLVTTIEQMLALRFLQALGGGFSTVICMASVRDIYPVEELGRRFATVTLIILVAPLVAPVIGASLLPLGWQTIFFLKAAYATLLVAIYAARVPETRHGAWEHLSVRSIFAQCAAVVSRRVDGRRVPIRFALAMALASSVLMTFVTNAAFIYMEYFELSAAQFPLLFGMSVVGLMSMNLFSMRHLRTDNAPKFFRRGLLTQLTAGLYLLLVVAAGAASLWTVVPAIILMLSMLGLVGPSGSAQYMAFFEQLAGSASSVHTTLMFSLGAVLGAAAGVFYDGTLLPVTAVMALASLAANAIAWSLPRRAVHAATRAR